MMPVRFSTSRNSKPPASLVMDPPSNCPRISRCFRGRNGNGSWLHSVIIRLSPFVGVTDTLNTFYATKRQPLLFSNEKCGLGASHTGAQAESCREVGAVQHRNRRLLGSKTGTPYKSPYSDPKLRFSSAGKLLIPLMRRDV